MESLMKTDEKKALTLLEEALACVEHKGATYHINMAKGWLRAGLQE